MASRAGQLGGGQRQVATMPGSGCTHRDLPTRWPTEHGWGWQCLQPTASPKLPALDSDRVLHPGGGADMCSPMQSPAGSCLCIGSRGLLVRTSISPRHDQNQDLCAHLQCTNTQDPSLRVLLLHTTAQVAQVFPESPDLPSDPALSTFIHCLEKKKLLVPATQT